MTGTVLRRRNGRPQACDPCRGRKVSCDHTQPVCLRCRRSKRPDKCAYTLSTHSVPSSSHKSTLQQSQSGVARNHSSTASPPSPSALPPTSLPTPEVSLAGPALSHNETSHMTPTPGSAGGTAEPRRSGYLGYTSYSTIFKETTHKLSRSQGTPLVPVIPQDAQRNPIAVPSTPGELSPLARNMGLMVLRKLSSHQKTNLPPGPSKQRWNGWVRLVCRRVLHSLHTWLGGDGSKLEELVRVLCENTAKPISEDVTDVDGYLAQFCGVNLRWESLGLLFTTEELFPTTPTSERGPVLMYLGMCVELAKQFSLSNLLQLFVTYQRMIMESNIGVGDAGKHRLAVCNASVPGLS